MRTVFVILHYMAGKDTIECIQSIVNNIDASDKKIVVVDNASTNDSFKLVKESFEGQNDIVFISNKENFGFAKGNNVGFQYAKYQLDADYIVLLNNDTIISQSDFCQVIENKYEEYQFAVLGPDIITADGYHQNPLKHRDWTVMKLNLFKLKAQLRLIDINLLSLGPKILEKKRRVTERTETLLGDHLGVRLHGACLIFSPLYIKKYDGLDERTFLYMEEDLLQIHMDQANLKMLYTGDLFISHKEDVSTNMVDTSQKNRNKRFLVNLIRSSNACIDAMREYQK